MRWVRYSGGNRDVDLPTEVAHRSVTGDTLMLVPGANYELTDDEWKHLESVGLADSFQLLALP